MGQGKSVLILNILLFIILTYFSYSLAFKTNYRIAILDDFNLLIHEAGHLIFTPFGQLVGLLGGTLLQLLIPIIFLFYFFIRKDSYGTIFSTFWLGENLINISIYIKDAKAQFLPLVGGGVHDWYAILSRWGILENYKLVSSVFFGLGCIFLIISVSINLFNIIIIYISDSS